MNMTNVLFKTSFLRSKEYNLYLNMVMEIDRISFITHPKLFTRFLILSISSFFIILLSFFLCYLDEFIVVEGVLRPSLEGSEIVSLYTGTIKKVYYKNAQFVNKGDLLFEQDCAYEQELLKNFLSLKKLYKKHALSLYETLNLVSETTIGMCPYTESFIKRNAEYSSFVNQYMSYKKEVDAKKVYFERQSALFPMSISKQELENAEKDFSQNELSFSTWIENQKIEILEKYSNYSERLQNVEMEILKTKKIIESASVKAKSPGIINEIKRISPGDFLNSETEILKITPNNSSLKALITIPNTKISKIKIQQKVLLQISDLPYTKYGKIEGDITLIPTDTASADDNYYSVEVTLRKNFVSDKKEKTFLKVGTGVYAKVIVDKNTIFQKFVQKIFIHDK